MFAMEEDIAFSRHERSLASRRSVVIQASEGYFESPLKLVHVFVGVSLWAWIATQARNDEQRSRALIISRLIILNWER